ncbi:hypothetical protein [Burkholderia sp. 567]|uniref:hypothetical protein n=1 Tax=Burkholderia sp. 567 TaxID=3156413 RepID=UPI0033956B89
MWLNQVHCINHQLLGEIIDEAGLRTNIDMTDSWKLTHPVNKRCRINVNTHLREWKRADSTPYLSTLENPSHYNENHHIYSFEINGITVMIPALVVIKEIFGQASSSFRFLFRPSGLETICAPIFGDNGVTIETFSQPKSLNPASKFDFEKMILQWIYCFPSARVAWDSVYTLATKGLIALTLPNIRAITYIHGNLYGSTLFAVSISLHEIEALEKPFDWAGRQPLIFQYSPKLYAPKSTARLKRTNIPKGEMGWALSDEEWRVAVEMFCTSSSTRYRDQIFRKFIDAILEKLGTGCSWDEVDFLSGTINGASNFYYKRNRNGTWQKFESALISIRTRTSLTDNFS